MSATEPRTAWDAGRFDAAQAPGRVLFGRMHEDGAIEARAFAAGSRVFCIASAGCTAIALSHRHEVVAVDVNPVQLAYAAARFAGAPASPGSAERFMGRLRALAPAVGWSLPTLRRFLELDDPAEQRAFWRRRLDTRRFRAAVNLAFSRPALRLVYARSLLGALPDRFGEVLRSRLERGFGRHPNRTNPHARALLLGELPGTAETAQAPRIRAVRADAADFLASCPAGAFDGFALSNILDGARSGYPERLFAAVRRAAAPRAMVVLRSFGEPKARTPTNLAAEDRSMLWGVVDVRPVEAL
ncbi:MAG TPA: DUF3419 domain-containing protein [Thermoanaerobaculia bacterium]|nr:DUF3419 domain-containing protein [Thermoanaerobaculia bacterium]